MPGAPPVANSALQAYNDIMSRSATSRPTRLSLGNAAVAEVADRLRDLDPDQRYEVMIQQRRSREEIFADMDRLSADLSARAKASGLTAEKLAETLGMDEEERRALLDRG